ncbi:hypothetical protein BU16DRAFT_554141 [Lophium mytilinum]|uniref:Uncharacterized protein n=1 Tax=Lophium mytilinum TaxID=390894 RepID=A0A6A6RCH6_9PEZI|nr:hypothetical protein BU16DRAFT_554141 [Lophium mytilinum]
MAITTTRRRPPLQRPKDQMILLHQIPGPFNSALTIVKRNNEIAKAMHASDNLPKSIPIRSFPRVWDDCAKAENVVDYIHKRPGDTKGPNGVEALRSDAFGELEEWVFGSRRDEEVECVGCVEEINGLGVSAIRDQLQLTIRAIIDRPADCDVGTEYLGLSRYCELTSADMKAGERHVSNESPRSCFESKAKGTKYRIH